MTIKLFSSRNLTLLTTAVIGTLASLTLTGCDNVRNVFGLDHYQADEFNVNTNKPLSMPPSYDELPTPTELDPKTTGDASKATAKDKAQQLVGAQSEKPEAKKDAIPSTTSEEILEKAKQGA